MKKIILDCDLMKHPNSGLYQYCSDLGNYVQKELEKENKENISFYIPRNATNAFQHKSSCIIEKKWHHKLFNPYLFDCDIWHAPFQSGRLIKKYNKKTKIVLTIHDLNVLHENKSKKERTESLKRTQRLIDSSDAIICISNHTKKDVISNLQIKDKPVYVIHNGTPELKKVSIQKPTGYHPQRPFVFSIGYVNKKKNFHSLIPLLENPDLELIVAGKLDDPYYVSKMKSHAIQKGIANRLHLLGPISEEDKAWYYENCKAFALPSLAEGFGSPVVEAMRFGKPIFLSNRTALPEIGGDVCFYFKNFEADHVKNIFNHGLQMTNDTRFIDKVIKRGIEFSWEDKAKEYVKVYQSLL